jgi:hypothetical protein
MGDAITGAAQEVWEFLVNAVTDPGPWGYVALILVAVATVAVLFRGKRSSWFLLPALAALGYWGWERFGP